MADLKNLSLKSVKVHSDMSEETVCFSAIILQDGKELAHISNDGRGGCHRVHAVNGLTYKDIAHIDNTDMEYVISDMVEEYDMVTKNQSKALVLKKDGNHYTQKLKMSVTKYKKEPLLKPYFDKLLKEAKDEGYQILNRNV